jgi:hypothetical protein
VPVYSLCALKRACSLLTPWHKQQDRASVVGFLTSCVDLVW